MHCWCKLHLRGIIHAHALFYVSEVAGCKCKSVVNTELTQTKTTSFNINTSSSCTSFSYLSRQSLVSHLNKKANISCANKLSEIGVFVHAYLHACGFAKVSHTGTARAIGPLSKWAMRMGSVGEEGLQAGYTQKKKEMELYDVAVQSPSDTVTTIHLHLWSPWRKRLVENTRDRIQKSDYQQICITLITENTQHTNL